MAVQPVGPFISEEGDKLPGIVESVRLLPYLSPQRRRLVEKDDAPVVVIGEGDDIKAGDIPSVGRISLRG